MFNELILVLFVMENLFIFSYWIVGKYWYAGSKTLVRCNRLCKNQGKDAYCKLRSIVLKDPGDGSFDCLLFKQDVL